MARSSRATSTRSMPRRRSNPRGTGARTLAIACAALAAALMAPASGQAPAGAAAADAPAATAASSTTLKVCADPNNLPSSDKAGAGYENKIAEALARDLRPEGRVHLLSAGHGLRAPDAARAGRCHAGVQVRRDHRRAEGLRARGHHASLHALDLRAGVYRTNPSFAA